MQAGGRRFDPVQLHQGCLGLRFSKSRYRLQASSSPQQCALARERSIESCLFFNNLEGKGASSLMRAWCTRVGCIFKPGTRKQKAVGWVAQTRCNGVSLEKDSRLWSQATKCMWWMPWRLQAMKDVAACEKLRGAGKRALIRRCPNGETRPARVTPT